MGASAKGRGHCARTGRASTGAGSLTAQGCGAPASRELSFGGQGSPDSFAAAEWEAAAAGSPNVEASPAGSSRPSRCGHSAESELAYLEQQESLMNCLAVLVLWLLFNYLPAPAETSCHAGQAGTASDGLL